MGDSARRSGGTAPRRGSHRARSPAAQLPMQDQPRSRLARPAERAEFETGRPTVPAAVAPPAVVPAHRVEHHAREIGLVGNDPSWRQVIDLAVTIAATRSSVLIVGEPGTGKSLLAQLIHSLGSAPDRPFITVEGSAMAEEHSAQRVARALAARPARTTLSIGPTSWRRPRAARYSFTKSPRCRWSCSSTCCETCNFETTRRARATPSRTAKRG